MLNTRTTTRTIVVAGLLLLCQACTLTIPVDDPALSEHIYSQPDGEQPELQFESSLPANHKASTSQISIALKYEGDSFDTDSFVRSNLEQELAARGVTDGFVATSDTVLHLREFEIYSRRVSGFSPMVTVTTARMDLATAQGTERLVSMVKMAKVPVWTMDEINEPCYNQPTELVIKELAAKINRKTSNGALSDEHVQALVNEIREKANDETLVYLDVYELGFSNNPTAIPALREFAEHRSDYVRLAAISALGILDVESEFPFLKSIYQNANLWQDRGMALKAMGDLGTDESLAFLRQERTRFANKTGDEAIWNDRIIGLYLDQ